ncbi:MAG: tRNA(Ile)(2)-agmatinylcytidine synthase [Candidatus Caldarchaeum sp.]|nr:tRNA(Ile)(2)-agmatinylcytidine synthase [Candidatus Caldarchaeum sp.]
MPVLRIGVDDTDSPRGMCTTYVGAVMERRLLNLGLKKLEHSHLIRLNPSCPFKTRGNAAVSLHFSCPGQLVDKAIETAVKTVEELFEKGYGETQPGVVVLEGDNVPREWRDFALRAVREMVELDEALRLAENAGARVFMYNGGRGVIGAVAAVACPLDNPTYEAIAYRLKMNWGTVRRVDKDSVALLHESKLTFDSFNPETKEPRITPHTPCPVLAGVRALTAENALKGLSMVRFLEEVELYTVYATNQATDMHLSEARVAEAKPFTNVIVEGRVVSKPRIIPGGHVLTEVADGTGTITCAAYRPTGFLRRVVSDLRPGDIVKVMGSLKPKPQGCTLNIEKIEVVQLADSTVLRPPKCPSCSRRMESAGRGKGYRCRRCGVRLDSSSAEKTVENRLLKPGLYEASVSARRHLSRPSALSLFPL